MWWRRALGRALDPQGGEGPVHARKPECLGLFERLAGGRRSETMGEVAVWLCGRRVARLCRELLPLGNGAAS